MKRGVHIEISELLKGPLCLRYCMLISEKKKKKQNFLTYQVILDVSVKTVRCGSSCYDAGGVVSGVYVHSGH